MFPHTSARTLTFWNISIHIYNTNLFFILIEVFPSSWAFTLCMGRFAWEQAYNSTDQTDLIYFGLKHS